MPDRVHYLSQFGGQSFEYIIIAERIWTRTDNQWLEGPSNGEFLLFQLIDREDYEFALVAENVQFLGTELVEGQAAMVDTYIINLNKSRELQIDIQKWVKIWIDPATGLPIRQEITSQVVKARTRTIRLIEYDNAIAIEAPLTP